MQFVELRVEPTDAIFNPFPISQVILGRMGGVTGDVEVSGFLSPGVT